MKHYIGIDLGTTNSAICSFDGENVRVWKSPEQYDVTPSAIFIDSRGKKYYGTRAYNNAPISPKNAATLFKRLMGTSTPIQIPAATITMTPEECSAEILKVLFGYLPEEIRTSEDIATVITVPAAFNQMQNEATLEAARMAGLGKVTLIQEPVAAVMTIMKNKRLDQTILIYDFGGGTLDLAIMESISGKINLLSHGGIAACGGRDFDRLIFNNIVAPWLMNNFSLPSDFKVSPNYNKLVRLATWAAERAKIDLSSKEESNINLTENEFQTQDLDEKEIYLDIPISRNDLNILIEDMLEETINTARETIEKAGLTSSDFDKIVFIGGPTNYKPLRDKVSTALAIPASIEVNPMTAVAEGASIFAESIDWSTVNRIRKTEKGEIQSAESIGLRFKYTSRTTDTKAKIIAQVNEGVSGYNFEITSMDSGWSSGRIELKNNIITELPVIKYGENNFKVKLFDSFGAEISLSENKIIITKTMATVEAIPASHSLSIEALDRLGGTPGLQYFVKEGDPLPKKGKMKFKAAESIRYGSTNFLRIKVWEGEIESPIKDNRFVGAVKITGKDFDCGILTAGSEIECEYEVSDSGNIMLVVSVPSIGAVFEKKNFYSRQEGQINLDDSTEQLNNDGNEVNDRIDRMESRINDERLEKARDKAQNAVNLDETSDAEEVKHAQDDLQDSKKIINQVRKENLKVVRQADLDYLNQFYQETVRQYATPTEKSIYEKLITTAQKAINNNDSNFEHYLDDMRGRNFVILFRQDWFVIDRFRRMSAETYRYIDKEKFNQLVSAGQQSINNDKIDDLRNFVLELYAIQVIRADEIEIEEIANIVRG